MTGGRFASSNARRVARSEHRIDRSQSPAASPEFLPLPTQPLGKDECLSAHYLDVQVRAPPLSRPFRSRPSWLCGAHGESGAKVEFSKDLRVQRSSSRPSTQSDPYPWFTAEEEAAMEVARKQQQYQQATVVAEPLSDELQIAVLLTDMARKRVTIVDKLTREEAAAALLFKQSHARGVDPVSVLFMLEEAFRRRGLSPIQANAFRRSIHAACRKYLSRDECIEQIDAKLEQVKLSEAAAVDICERYDDFCEAMVEVEGKQVQNARLDDSGTSWQEGTRWQDFDKLSDPATRQKFGLDNSLYVAKEREEKVTNLKARMVLRADIQEIASRADKIREDILELLQRFDSSEFRLDSAYSNAQKHAERLAAGLFQFRFRLESLPDSYPLKASTRDGKSQAELPPCRPDVFTKPLGLAALTASELRKRFFPEPTPKQEAASAHPEECSIHSHSSEEFSQGTREQIVNSEDGSLHRSELDDHDQLSSGSSTLSEPQEVADKHEEGCVDTIHIIGVRRDEIEGECDRRSSINRSDVMDLVPSLADESRRPNALGLNPSVSSVSMRSCTQQQLEESDLETEASNELVETVQSASLQGPAAFGGLVDVQVRRISALVFEFESSQQKSKKADGSIPDAHFRGIHRAIAGLKPLISNPRQTSLEGFFGVEGRSVVGGEKISCPSRGSSGGHKQAVSASEDSVGCEQALQISEQKPFQFRLPGPESGWRRVDWRRFPFMSGAHDVNAKDESAVSQGGCGEPDLNSADGAEVASPSCKSSRLCRPDLPWLEAILQHHVSGAETVAVQNELDDGALNTIMNMRPEFVKERPKSAISRGHQPRSLIDPSIARTLKTSIVRPQSATAGSARGQNVPRRTPGPGARAPLCPAQGKSKLLGGAGACFKNLDFIVAASVDAPESSEMATNYKACNLISLSKAHSKIRCASIILERRLCEDLFRAAAMMQAEQVEPVNCKHTTGLNF